MRDVVEVQPARGDVGRDEHVVGARRRSGRAHARAARCVMPPCKRARAEPCVFRFFASRSAPRCVRTKISVRPRSAASSRTSACDLAALLDRDEAVVARRSTSAPSSSATSCVTGSCVKRAASRPDLAVERGGEQHRLAVGRSISRMRFTSGRKPMSSMRSASSSTQIRTRSRRSSLRAHEVEQPAGRGDRRCRRGGRAWPAGRSRRRRRRRRRGGCRTSAIARNSSVTWLASSRVGARISAVGLPPLGVSRSTIGTANASVLPEPVRERASTSRPAIASRSTSVLDRERRRRCRASSAHRRPAWIRRTRRSR